MAEGWFARLVARAGRIGADPSDDSDLALKKRLLVLLSLAVVPAAALWSAIYFAAGAPLAAFVPGAFTIIAPVNTLVFGVTRRLGFYRFTQLLVILVLPFLLMLSLGGYKTVERGDHLVRALPAGGPPPR